MVSVLAWELGPALVPGLEPELARVLVPAREPVPGLALAREPGLVRHRPPWR